MYFVVIVVCLGWTLLFGSTLLYLLFDFYKARQSRAWTATPGVAKAVGIKASEGEDDHSYRVEIEVEYSVGGKVYTCSNFHMDGGEVYSNEREARKVAAGYKVGKEMPIYVNPADPQQSTVFKGPEPKGGLAVVVGAVFFAISVGVLMAAIFR